MNVGDPDMDNLLHNHLFVQMYESMNLFAAAASINQATGDDKLTLTPHQAYILCVVSEQFQAVNPNN